MAKQFSKVQQRGGTGAPEFRWADPETNVSWKVRQKGRASLSVTAYPQGRLSVVGGEHYVSGDSGMSVNRQTMLELDADSARALYEFLRAQYEAGQ